ncbi:MAG: VanW family protein [Clostridiales bacterium]|nr:VanW family protein [Clostridiales bacterium]
MQYRQGYQPPPLPAPDKRKRISKKAVALTLSALVLCALAVGGILIAGSIRRANAERQALKDAVEAYDGVYAPNIVVDGVRLEGKTPQEAIDAVLEKVNARQNSWTLNLTYRGHTFYTLDYASLGVTTDVTQVYSLLEELYRLGKVGTLEERKAEIDALRETPRIANTTQSEMTDALLDSVLSQIRDALSWAPVDAYLVAFSPDLEDPFTIQPDHPGSTLDVEKAKQQVLSMAAAGQSGDLEMEPDTVPAQVTEAEVRNQFTLLCKAVTPISTSSSEYRNSNIRTAFSYINGTVVSPGDTFNFNRITQDRTFENGYRPAIEYGEGGLETVGIGGGVCQASTTVYLAALQSGLEIVERSPHADQVSYTTFGQDATVVYNRLNLRFKNNYNSPVYITARVETVGKSKSRYQCVVCIYGPSLGEGVSYKLRTQEQVEVIPAPLNVSYVKDTEHQHVTYTDETYLYREARDGFINETYLQKWVNGQMFSETFVSRDECKAREAVYLVGTLSR